VEGCTAITLDTVATGVRKRSLACVVQVDEGSERGLSRLSRALSFAVIRALTEETGTTIDIQDDGTVTIACVSPEAGELAKKRIEDITADVEVGRIYDGTVLKLLDFGAIVSVLPGKDGLLHISQIANERVNAVADHLKEGQQVRVKVLEADDKGRLRLSMKAVAAEAKAAQAAQ